MGVSAFRFPIVDILGLVAITTICTALFPCEHGMVAWARATSQYHMNGTDTIGRSVGRLMQSRGVEAGFKVAELGLVRKAISPDSLLTS